MLQFFIYFTILNVIRASDVSNNSKDNRENGEDNGILDNVSDEETLSIDISAYKRGLKPANVTVMQADAIDEPKNIIIAKGTRRIFNADETVSIEEHPYMAAILFHDELWCGGVIIGRDKVLTAAHCLQLQYNNRFFREYVRMISIRIGSANVTEGGQLLKVGEIFFHPNYEPQTLQFNVAVLILNKNLTIMDDKIKLIDYSRKTNLPTEADITFLGWGATEDSNDRGGEVLLQKVSLPMYNLRDCQEIYGRDLVTTNNFCAGYITVLKNVCNHDAGGPAMLNGEVIGILSFSHSRCDVADKPAVFTAVGRVSQWLDNIHKRSATGYNIAG